MVEFPVNFTQLTINFEEVLFYVGRTVTDHSIEHLDTGDPNKNVLVVHQHKNLLHLYYTAVSLECMVGSNQVSFELVNG